MWYFCACDLVNNLALTAVLNFISLPSHSLPLLFHTNKHTNINLPTGNLSNHINAVFTCKPAKVGDDCCCYDLLKKGTSNASVFKVNHYFPFGKCKTRSSSVSQSSIITVVKMPPAGLLNEHTCCVNEKEKQRKQQSGGLTTMISIGMGIGSFCL